MKKINWNRAVFYQHIKQFKSVDSIDSLEALMTCFMLNFRDKYEHGEMDGCNCCEIGVSFYKKYPGPICKSLRRTLNEKKKKR